MKDCIFCEIAKEKTNREKIYENKDFFSILDANPVMEGHSLVIPKKHHETSLDLPNELGPNFLDCVKKTAKKLMEKYNASGFNILNNNFEIAGQVVNHLHFHIMPRKEGDNVKGTLLWG
jgi:histidine triad (HIT) family protein